MLGGDALEPEFQSSGNVCRQVNDRSIVASDPSIHRAARKRWLLRRSERMLLCGQRPRRRFCERQARMTIHSRREVVTFKHPFRIKGIDRLLPAGAYEVVTDEEMIEGLSFAAFRRVATMIKVPTEGSRGLAMEVVSIGPVDLSDAQRMDASISDG
jgi:hypothetical protein